MSKLIIIYQKPWEDYKRRTRVINTSNMAEERLQALQERNCEPRIVPKSELVISQYPV